MRNEQRWLRIAAAPNEVAVGVSVIVEMPGRKLAGNEDIEFFRNGVHIGAAKTDDQGRAHLSDIPPASGKFYYEVQIKGTTYRDGKVVEWNKPKTEKETGARPRLKSLEVDTPGENGRYAFVISILDEHGKPAEGVFVKIFDDDDGSEVRNGRTNKDGTLDPAPRTDFKDEWKQYLVSAPGFIKKVKLYGPPKHRTPPPVPEPSKDDLQGNIWSIAKNAWQRGAADLKKKRRKS